VEIIEVETILYPKKGDSISKKYRFALEESADTSSADEMAGGPHEIPLYCVVENNRPPSNRIRPKFVSSKTIWTCIKRLKGVSATRENLVDETHVCRVPLENGEFFNKHVTLTRGKDKGNFIETRSWIDTKVYIATFKKNTKTMFPYSRLATKPTRHTTQKSP
jgi:hypothetical protein